MTENVSRARGTIIISEQKVVSLREELRTVRAYLTLQMLRYEERLMVEMVVDEPALDTLVPPFLVQTLVENALKHGDYSEDDKRSLKCRIQAKGEMVHIQVTNPGVLAPTLDGSGTGLCNAEERLQLLYGSKARLRVYPCGRKNVTAEVELPRLWHVS